MKAEEFLTERQLDEMNLKHVGANTALALAAFNAGVVNPMYSHGDEKNLRPQAQTTMQARADQEREQQQKQRKSSGFVSNLFSPGEKPTGMDFSNSNVDTDKAAALIARRFKVKPELAQNVVNLAKKYERPDFPKADDILSVIAIESAFNPQAISNLKKDPALGLTQVRAKMWGQDPKTFLHDIEQQIKVSSNILDKYNKELNNPLDAVHAYNVGLAGFRKGDLNPSYVEKFKKAKQLYK